MEFAHGLVLLICGLLVFFANTMILINHPMKSALSLVACMLCVAVIWVLLDVEYFAYLLLFLYVGAVMTLFLFMVMMMNASTYAVADQISCRGALTVLFFTVVLPLVLFGRDLSSIAQLQMKLFAIPQHVGLAEAQFLRFAQTLYHKYFWLLQGLAVLLAVPVVFAAGVVHETRSATVNRQDRNAQISTCAQDRITLIKKKSRG